MNHMQGRDTILVIGASGYLGAEISRQAGSTVIGTHFSKRSCATATYNFFDDSIETILARYQNISTVVFAAAVERQQIPMRAFELAVENFLVSISRRKLRLVYISSDAVFSGNKGGYKENDHPDAETQYGRNLRVFEQKIQEIIESPLIVRCSYLFGDTISHKDRRVEQALSQLMSGLDLYRFNNVYKSPINVSDAASCVIGDIQAGTTGTRHLVAKRQSLYDFYRQQCIGLGELAARIKPCNATADRVDGFDTSLLSVYTYETNRH